MKEIARYLLCFVGIIVFFLALVFSIQVIRSELSSGIYKIVVKGESAVIGEIESLRAEVDILKQQLLLISRSAILRRTASGTEFVTFSAHLGSDEYIDIRKSSSTAEILADDWAIKKDEERIKKEKEGKSE